MSANRLVTLVSRQREICGDGALEKALGNCTNFNEKNGITQNYGIKIVLYFNFSLTNQFVTFYSILILNGALKNKC